MAVIEAEAHSWAVFGAGHIGGELIAQVGKPDVAERFGLRQDPEFVVRRTGLVKAGDLDKVYAENIDHQEIPDVTFIALPSSGLELANAVMTQALEAGRVVVTAEKGILSSAPSFERFRTLSDNFSRLGINATVGGGTRLMKLMQAYTTDVPNVTEAHLAVNGTLTSIFHAVASGASLGQAVSSAKTNGFAEPEQTSPHEVIRGEVTGDVPKKIAILFNFLGLGETLLDAGDIEDTLSEAEIRRAVAEAKTRRYVVSLYQRDLYDEDTEGIIAKHVHTHDSWQIVTGFQNVDRNPLIAPLGKLADAGNGFVIGLGPSETDGVYGNKGPGAGEAPTVNTMLDDWLTISRANSKG